MPRPESFFRRSSDGHFMHIWGPAWNEGKGGCQKKLCFTATEKAVLVEVLGELAARPDCVYVKYSIVPLDGMYLGRCFLVDEYEIGRMWAKFKAHPRLFCNVQDDDFTAPFRDLV